MSEGIKQTPEQEAQREKLYEQYRRWSYGPVAQWSTEEQIKKAVNDCLEWAGIGGRPVLVFDGPKTMKQFVRDNAEASPVSLDWIGITGQYWLCHYDHLVMNVGVDCEQKLRDGINLTRELFVHGVGGGIAFENAVLVFRRPIYVKWDSRNRLHCDNGPSIEFLDGTKLYNYHGVRLTKTSWIIEQPHLITHEKVMEERNVEIRRVMVEVMGMERWMADAKFTVLDTVQEKDHEGREIVCKLLSFPIGDEDEIRMTEVCCPSTGKTVHERVPSSIRTYQAARAWQWDTVESPQEESIWET